MQHIKELKQLLSNYFTFSRHGLECLTYFIFGMLIVHTVNLAQIANSCGSTAKNPSIYKRFQRFIKYMKFKPEELFAMNQTVFNLKGKLTLCLDRTNWKIGKVHVNYLVISMAYNGVAIPLLWSLLTDKKCGNSDFEDRRQLFDRLLQFIDPSRIEVLLADREFFSADWVAYLKSHRISFVIRVKENLITYNSQGKKISLNQLFKSVPVNKTSHLKRQRTLLGCEISLSCKKLEGGELLILASSFASESVTELYRIRWQIETLFSALKKRGFNLEATHIATPERLSNLFFIVSIAFIWAYRQGDICLSAKTIRLKPKKHGYAQCSIVRAGMDIIAKAISEMLLKPKKILASLRLIFKRNLTEKEKLEYLGVL